MTDKEYSEMVKRECEIAKRIHIPNDEEYEAYLERYAKAYAYNVVIVWVAFVSGLVFLIIRSLLG